MGRPVVLKGLEFNFDEADAEAARGSGRMLLFDIDFSERCDLNCSYCDRFDDRKAKARAPLTAAERIDLFRQAKALGCRTVEIPGVGEPMLDPDFWRCLEEVHSLAMTTVLYTSAYSDDGCLIDDRSAARLKALDVSVVLKYESLDRGVQDRLVRRDGYSAVAEEALLALLKAGFNTAGVTRLGLHTVVTGANRDGVLDILRFCRTNNVFPYIVSSIPDGNALRTGCVVDRREAEAVVAEIAAVDRAEYRLDYEPVVPVGGGFSCRQLNVGLFVDLYGDVFECNAGGEQFGNIRDHGSLAAVWNLAGVRSLRARAQNGYCPVRERYWSRLAAAG